MPLHEERWGCITKTGSRMKRLKLRPKTIGIIGSDRSLSGYNILTPSNQNTLKYFPINEMGMDGEYITLWSDTPVFSLCWMASQIFLMYRIPMMGALARRFRLEQSFVAKNNWFHSLSFLAQQVSRFWVHDLIRFNHVKSFQKYMMSVISQVLTNSQQHNIWN